MKYNLNYLVMDDVEVNPAYIKDTNITVGQGINLTDPRNPKTAPFSPFKARILPASQKSSIDSVRSEDVIKENFYIKQVNSEHEFEQTISTYFKATYGLSSVSAAGKFSKKEMDENHHVYAILNHTGEGSSLPDNQKRWADETELESFVDDNDALAWFIDRYGTHYVSSIRHGLNIAIEAKVNKQKCENSNEVEAAVKAAFGGFGAEAGVKTESKEKFSSWNAEIRLEVTSGGCITPGMPSPSNLEQTFNFLERLNSGDVEYKVAPLTLICKNYRPTTKVGSKMRQILSPDIASYVVPPAIYGVPRGTIVAWFPTEEYINGLETDVGRKNITPPSGWAICDGRSGTPDLRNSFIRGTSEYVDLSKTGVGSEEHFHTGVAKAFDQEAHQEWWWSMGTPKQHRVTDASHEHDVEIEKASHLPPHLYLVYIMKL